MTECREQFEKWFFGDLFDESKHRTLEGTYTIMSSQSSWKAWEKGWVKGTIQQIAEDKNKENNQ